MDGLKIWNWQKDDWPDFRFDAGRLAGLEADFLRRAGVFSGSFLHIAQDGQDSLTVELMSEEAMKTSEIEGEILNRDSVQSSIRRHFGFWVCT
jgi:Fic family protein